MAAALLLVAGLALLTGCQGFSSGSNQTQASSLSLSSATLSFGNVTAGSTKTLSATATNSGPATVTISGVAISTKYFSLTAPSLPLTLAAGQSTPVSIMFSPNATGAFSASVTVTSNASNSTALTLTGTGTSASTPGQLTLNPSSEAFGNETVGDQQSQAVTLTNTGGTSVTISQASVSGSGFGLTGITTPLTLNASQNTTFNVLFAPQASGSASGTVTISSNASDATLNMALSGTGVAAGALGASPASLSFGNVTVGSDPSLSEAITNTGGTTVTISQIAISGTGYSLSGITAPVTLTAGQKVSFTVSFDPTAAGTDSGSITITSNGSNPTLTIPLSGSGVTAGTLSPSPASLSFGSVTVGNNEPLTEKITNSGGTSVTISQVAISGTGFTLSGVSAPVTLTAGQSTSFTVTFTPASAASASGTVTVTSNGSNPTLSIPLSGTGISPGDLSPSPASLSFGNVTVGSNGALTEKITNGGGTSVTISQVTISGTGFTLSGISTPVTLTAGQNTSFTVTFTPASAGSASGTVTVTSNGSNPTLSIPLSGTGVAAVGSLAASPATLAIGNVTVGSTGTGSGSLTASGASVTVSAVNSNNSVFTVSGLSFPVTIPAGQSVPFTVTFDPTTTGAESATLTFTSNAQPSTTTEAVTGTGTAASAHSVSLSWDASTSSDINGYNIYRAAYSTSTSTCGSYGKINSALVTVLLYTDSAVTDGDAYCYAATAVDSSGDESGYSNIVSDVQIPTT